MGDVMYRFLLRPRWILGHLLLIVTVVAFVNLGFWQLRRLDERRDHNALVTARLADAAQPLDAVVAVAGDGDAIAFRRAGVEGTYVPDEQILTGPRTFEGQPGQQVLSVLERDNGPAVLVDRGWIPYDSRAPQVPPAPAGRVHVDGVVRLREPGPSGDAAQVAQIVPSQIGERVGRPLAPFYLQLQSQEPPAGPDGPQPTPLPELTEGSHRSYAVQWFSFALIALIGYPLLLWRAARDDDVTSNGPQDGGGRGVTVGSAVGR
jgi:cytochrome oxidase assembly protein ShyY1